MPAVIHVIRGRDMLQVSLNGIFDPVVSDRAFQDIGREAPSPPDYNILLDLRLARWRMSEVESFQLAERLSTVPELLQDRIAILMTPGPEVIQAEFLALCACNRGLTVEVFGEFEKAVRWFFEAGIAPPQLPAAG